MKTTQEYKPRKIKRLFWKLGGCSHLFFHILNRHYNHPRVNEERASDPLAGGILQAGHQCGMLWGASMAAGAEAHRRYKDENLATAMAIIATQNIMRSFENRTKNINCREITKCNWKSPASIFKYFITGKAISCFRLAEKWAPEAIEAAEKGISKKHDDILYQCLSCTSELAKKMGATKEQITMVSGLAGGMGLRGHACSALATAIWLKSISDEEEVPIKKSLANPHLKKIETKFLETTGKEKLCRTITGKEFKGPADHTEYIQNGGCEKIITMLAEL